MRQVGLILGPFWVFWTKHWNFTIAGGLVVDENNSTGLLITILWCLVLIVNIYAVSKEPITIIKSKSEYLESGNIVLSENGDCNHTVPNGDANANGTLLSNEKIPTKRLSITSQHRYAQVCTVF